MILWTATPSLVEAFHAAFYYFSPPTSHAAGLIGPSTSWILADEFCAAWYDIKICPGVVNSLGTPRSTEHPDHICTTIQSDGVTQGVNRSVRPSRVMESFKEWIDQWGRKRRPSGGKKSKMPHEILLRDSESRSIGSRFWCNFNLKILFPGSRTRDFTVVGRYNYRWAVKAFIKLDELTTVKSRVRLPGDIIFRLRLHHSFAYLVPPKTQNSNLYGTT